jgi:hypothetical protein
MGKPEVIRCDDVEVFADMLHLVLRPLYEFGSRKCLGCIRLSLYVAIAKLFLTNRFGEPIAEGLYCPFKDERFCYRYVLIYRCVEGNSERFAEVSIEDNYEYGLIINAISLSKDLDKLLENVKPIKLTLNINEERLGGGGKTTN